MVRSHHHHVNIVAAAEDIEFCGTGWKSVIDGSAKCESGHCCSIHGTCGVQDYHCHYGLSAEWVLFHGIILMCITALIYNFGVHKRIITLMNTYKRRGERVDAIVVVVAAAVTKTTTRKATTSISSYDTAWQAFRARMEEGLSHCKWKQITIEYTTKSNNTNGNNKTTTSSSSIQQQQQQQLRVRKTLSVGKHVLQNKIKKWSSTKNKSNNNNNNDNDDNDDVIMIRVLVLPNYPFSAFPRDDVDWMIIKQLQKLRAAYITLIVLIGLYIYLFLIIMSVIGGEDRKALGWRYFCINFLWAPPLAYLLSSWREQVEYQRWVQHGKFVSSSLMNNHNNNNNNNNDPSADDAMVSLL